MNNMEYYQTESVFEIHPAFNISKVIKYEVGKLFKTISEFDYDYYTMRVLQNIPMAFVITYLGFLAVFNLMKVTEAQNGIKIYPILTSSMHPEIIPGSLVFSGPSASYKKGDVVSYIEKTNLGVPTGKILTHRIIDKTESGKYIAKGDANSDPDPVEINKSQVQGKVFKSIPLLGYLDILIKTLPGFLVLVAAPSFLIVAGQIKEIKRYSSREN